MSTAADYNSFTHQRLNGVTLAGGESCTIDGPCTLVVAPAGRVIIVLVNADDTPIGVPVVASPSGNFAVAGDARAEARALDPWGAAVRFIWG